MVRAPPKLLHAQGSRLFLFSTMIAWMSELPTFPRCASRLHATGIHRHSGDKEWIVRAFELSRLAVQACNDEARMTNSLFKGALGAAVLVEDLNIPERASFPLFEREQRSRELTRPF
jgi:serine/threonine-protein kinase